MIHVVHRTETAGSTSRVSTGAESEGHQRLVVPMPAASCPTIRPQPRDSPSLSPEDGFLPVSQARISACQAARSTIPEATVSTTDTPRCSPQARATVFAVMSTVHPMRKNCRRVSSYMTGGGPASDDRHRVASTASSVKDRRTARSRCAHEGWDRSSLAARGRRPRPHRPCPRSAADSAIAASSHTALSAPNRTASWSATSSR
ncbi:hypothetical protein GCM10020256_01850 [Streptomyces thermocoprophilus]